MDRISLQEHRINDDKMGFGEEIPSFIAKKAHYNGHDVFPNYTTEIDGFKGASSKRKHSPNESKPPSNGDG